MQKRNYVELLILKCLLSSDIDNTQRYFYGVGVRECGQHHQILYHDIDQSN